MASEVCKKNRERKIKELCEIREERYLTKYESDRLIKLWKLKKYYDLLDGTIKSDDREVNEAIEYIKKAREEKKELIERQKKEEEEKKRVALKYNINTLIREQRNRIRAEIK